LDENGTTDEFRVYLFNDVMLICVPIEKGKMHLRYLMEFRGRIGIKIEDVKDGFSSEVKLPSDTPAEGYPLLTTHFAGAYCFGLQLYFGL